MRPSGWPPAFPPSTAKPPREFPRVVSFELGDREFAAGDSITIQELRGTTDLVQTGGVYCVTGTYTLNSQPEADLSFFRHHHQPGGDAHRPTPNAAHHQRHRDIPLDQGDGRPRLFTPDLLLQQDRPGVRRSLFWSGPVGAARQAIHLSPGCPSNRKAGRRRTGLPLPDPTACCSIISATR